ncbi:MAG: RES family NAD+ phosphorylase, partial [Rhodoglobus sp.]
FDSTALDTYEYLYAGESDSTAIAEALLRDVEANDRGYRFLSKNVWGGRQLSRVETAAALQIVSLRTGQDLGAIGADTWLTTSDPDDYPQTRAWAKWLRSVCPSASGVAWLSKREPGTTSYVIFGDRCPAGALHLSAPPVPGACVFDEPDGFDWLRNHLAPYRVSIRR